MLLPVHTSHLCDLFSWSFSALSPHQHNTGKPKEKVKHLSIQLKGLIVPEVKLNY